MLELRLDSLGSDFEENLFLAISDNGAKNLMRIVLNTTLLCKYTNRSSNTITIVKDRSHKDCIKSLRGTIIKMI